MHGYCKNCHCTHSAWSRLIDGFICGLCGSRKRDLRVTPLEAQQGSSTRQPARSGRPSF